MNSADLKALREVPGCGGVGWTVSHHLAAPWYNCDACLALLAAAVIRQAVARVPSRQDENQFCPVDPKWCKVDRYTTVRRSALLAALLPTPPTMETEP